MFADIITTTRPQICTIRKDTFGVSEDIFSTTKTCDIIQHNLKKVPRIAGLSTMRIKYSEKQLLNADLSLIVGNALRDEEDLKLFYQLAELLDCELYGTRPVIERGLLDPDYKEVFNGKAEVRQVFKVPKVGAVAGCYILEGKVTRSSHIRVVRDGKVINESEIESLRRFKDDVKEVAEGYECGIGLKNFHDIKEGDIFEAFIMEEVKREL